MSIVQKKVTGFDVFLVVLMTVLSAMFIYPLLNTLAISLSDATVLLSYPVYLWPMGFSLDAYAATLMDKRTLLYYWNTISYAAVGTVIMLLCTSLMAYPLSFKELRGRKFFTIMLTITMFFGGGMIPTYITIMKYGMLDTFAVMVIPGFISAYNVIVFRTFFQGLPDELRESAFLDGAGHFRVLFQIVLPLSTAILATYALFSIVGYWNDYMSALLYLQDSDKYPIQMLMRRLLVLLEYDNPENRTLLQEMEKVSTRTVRAAACIVTVVPILCVYPFLQKYFAKGVLVGSVKG